MGIEKILNLNIELQCSCGEKYKIDKEIPDAEKITPCINYSIVDITKCSKCERELYLEYNVNKNSQIIIRILDDYK